jgi:hypothetical protein
MKKIILILFAGIVSGIQLKAQNVKITYKESDEDFTNPERGFYIPTGTKASNFILLDAARLKTFRSQPQQLNGASYQVNVTLIYRGYELDTFKNQPLSGSFLANLQKDFDAVRATGLKLILRFAYTNTIKTGNCKDEYKICPPYGDAPRDIVLKHVLQLKPLFQKNADVIAVLQQGFIGIWGENYFTDYFGCASDDGQGFIPDSSWNHRNEFLKALLDAMPNNRMIQVRTPQIKQRFVYGPHALITSQPLLLKGAYSKTDIARVGFHNDCFLAGTDDYGTFYDYGNSVSKKDTANIILRKYFEADSRYVAIGGETCDDAFSPQNDCAPVGHAEQEMAAMHYSYLNAGYNNQVNNGWNSLGCMKSIKQKLGYRLVLRNAFFPKSILKEKSFTVQIQLENIGYASPYNERPVQLILRNKTTGKLLVFNFNTQIQKWFTSKIMLKQTFNLPPSIIAGQYELLVNLPDGYKSLQNNPAYSIRLANENVWEPSSGFNQLQHTIQIQQD